MSKYADVNEVVKILTNNQTYSATVIQAIIDRVPAADVEPVRHAHWIKYERYAVNSDGKPILKTGEELECSLCGRIEKKEEPYCNCGAKMDEEVEE